MKLILLFTLFFSLIPSTYASEISSAFKSIFSSNILRNWYVPSGVSGLRANVEVQIYKDGTIKSIKILKPSGNKELDKSIIEAVKAAYPYTSNMLSEEVKNEIFKNKKTISYTATFTAR